MNKFGFFSFSLILVLTMTVQSYGEEIPKTTQSTRIVITISPPNVGTPFDPEEVHIAPNSTVTWVNKDNVTHTVTSGNPQQGLDGRFDSGLLKPGKEFSYTFTEIGAFDYYCQFHPSMKGKVIVDANTVPEFPLTAPILLVSITLLIVFYKIRLKNENSFN